GRRRLATYMDEASRGGKLVRDQDLRRSLNNLKRESHIRRARNTRQITLGLGIAGCLINFPRNGTIETFLKIFFFLCLRPRLIWDLTSLHHAQPGRCGADGAGKRWKGCRSRSMRFKVPIGAV